MTTRDAIIRAWREACWKAEADAADALIVSPMADAGRALEAADGDVVAALYAVRQHQKPLWHWQRVAQFLGQVNREEQASRATRVA
jgi:hypothetical protein